MSDPQPPGWLKPMNKVMMALQKLGVVTGPVRVVTVVGRKSGRPRSTPATPFTMPGDASGAVYVAGGYPKADWVLNARAAGEGVVTKGRSSQRVAFVELGADEARPVLRAFPSEVPGGVGFYKRAGLVNEGTPDEFEALAGRCAVFRLDPIAVG